ncbi:c-type cytochrome [Methylobacterium platani]|uniref:Cytochrome C n=1 Tax=Methylobacterium platani TaxID=427683 RepID=A0A179SAF3_9HYPH|nr:c-type cytochrome [Methylobacterium platani]OAS24346.1 cytochrome C [Methylobacterium platani]
MTRAATRLPLVGLALLVAACSDDDGQRRRALGATPGFSDLMRVADPVRGGRLFGPCAACHTVRAGAGDRNGPGLFDVVGKPPGENSRRFGYTAALRSLGGVWSPERLDVWLTAPATMVPGTSMGFPGIPDPLDRADLIAYLQTLSAGGSGRSPPSSAAR